MTKIILIEGTDCSGKETQSKLLVEKLNKREIKAVYYTFPNYESPTGKIIGGPYLGKKEIGESYFSEGAANVDGKVACLYYAADRLYNLNNLKNYLNNGYNIILDRYVYSNMAHQGGQIEDKKERLDRYKFIEELEFNMLKLIKPDYTIFLHMPYEYACKLKKNRTNLDGLEESEIHLKNAERAYLELNNIYNFEYINCINNGKIKTIEEINKEIEDIVLSDINIKKVTR